LLPLKWWRVFNVAAEAGAAMKASAAAADRSVFTDVHLSKVINGNKKLIINIINGPESKVTLRS
jgi:hypothetical protein